MDDSYHKTYTFDDNMKNSYSGLIKHCQVDYYIYHYIFIDWVLDYNMQLTIYSGGNMNQNDKGRKNM